MTSRHVPSSLLVTSMPIWAHWLVPEARAHLIPEVCYRWVSSCLYELNMKLMNIQYVYTMYVYIGTWECARACSRVIASHRKSLRAGSVHSSWSKMLRCRARALLRWPSGAIPIPISYFQFQLSISIIILKTPPSCVNFYALARVYSTRLGF